MEHKRKNCVILLHKSLVIRFWCPCRDIHRPHIYLPRDGHTKKARASVGLIRCVVAIIHGRINVDKYCKNSDRTHKYPLYMVDLLALILWLQMLWTERIYYSLVSLTNDRLRKLFLKYGPFLKRNKMKTSSIQAILYFLFQCIGLMSIWQDRFITSDS